MKSSKKIKKVFVFLLVFTAIILGIFFVVDLICYAGLNKKVYVELGDSLPEAEAFLKDIGEIEYITDISKINHNEEGKHQIKVNYNGKEKKVYLIIEDTLAPEVLVKDVEISVYDELSAKDLIVEVADKSKVKIEYKKKPEFGKVGKYNAVIRVKDEAGNITEVTSVVNVRRVKEYVEYRYGESYPDVSEFIFSEKDTGKLLTDIDSTINKPGTYYVAVEIEGQTYKSKLIVIDDEAPIVVGRDAEITYKEIEEKNFLMPSDFVQSFYDRDDVTMYFIDTPNYVDTQESTVSIAVADNSGNTTIINRKMYIVEHKGLDVKIGSGELTDNILTAGLDCIKATFVSGSVDTNKLGRYEVVANVDGKDKTIYVNVVDTDAPSATPVEVTLETKQDIIPSMFVSDINDMTNVSVIFENEPDRRNRGIQNIRIILTDEAGNFSYVDTTLNILYDAIEPEISGVASVSTYIRQKPEYLLGVTATDDVDGNIAVTVDDSKVNYEVAGIYEVVYRATDSTGNTVTQTTNVEVKNVTRELVDSMADDILSGIVNDSMTITEKSLAIYEYIQANVRYINQADQSSIEKAAYDGLTLGVGDCYTFAALIEVFIERIGGETVFVSRDSDTSNHYWMLCNLGTGWYHMDATPRNSVFKCFMKTDAEVLAESSYYWEYDKTLYPAVATEIYSN